MLQYICNIVIKYNIYVLNELVMNMKEYNTLSCISYQARELKEGGSPLPSRYMSLGKGNLVGCVRLKRRTREMSLVYPLHSMNKPPFTLLSTNMMY